MNLPLRSSADSSRSYRDTPASIAVDASPSTAPPHDDADVEETAAE